MGSFLSKAKRFASSPEGRRAIGGLTNRGTGTTGRTTRAGRSTPAAGGAGGTLGRLASGLLGGRRR